MLITQRLDVILNLYEPIKIVELLKELQDRTKDGKYDLRASFTRIIRMMMAILKRR